MYKVVNGCFPFIMNEIFKFRDKRSYDFMAAKKFKIICIKYFI